MSNKEHIFKVQKELMLSAQENNLLTYVSLFSSAGVGCYGFQLEGFQCIATAELIERRIAVQKYNHKCAYESGYICGDMTKPEVKAKILKEIENWKRCYKIEGPDVLIATPPCQGMSVANHKKNPDKEIKRNSLVIESIVMTLQVLPKCFVFENVRAFLDTICVDVDETPKAIKEAIEEHLSGKYNILYKVVNFKDYGNKSSRTRTLVIGTRKDLKDISPFDVFPDRQKETTLRENIGYLPSLKQMGETQRDDIFHNFRSYNPEMRKWIENLKEGESAFDNEDPTRRPHTIKNGVIVYNVEKNADKYTRQVWDKVAPCVHTRNDILASQNTVHPVDDRVFSIRELMIMMSIPKSFKWTNDDLETLNALDEQGRAAFLKKNEINIRQTIGEAVPTIIFQQIAQKYNALKKHSRMIEPEIKAIITNEKLIDTNNLRHFIRSHAELGFVNLSKIAELANAERDKTAAYYTGQNVCFDIVRNLPSFSATDSIKVLEPSVGVGNFLPCLFKFYADVKHVELDVVDINADSLSTLNTLLEVIDIPDNFSINFINDDFLLHDFNNKHYNVVVGNPPYMQISNMEKLRQYRFQANNQITNNIFAFFIEKAMSLGDVVSFVVPKSLINTPEFKNTRDLMNGFNITSLIDFGEKGFKGVKIETIAFAVSMKGKSCNTKICSYITNESHIVSQSYYTDPQFPYWLIYRNEEFSTLAQRMTFNLFDVFRDRKITKKITTTTLGQYRVLKSRNIGDQEIINIEGYDSYVNNLDGLVVAKYLNNTNCILVPNLTYNPRACRMPKNCIADGSVAILTPKDPSLTIKSKDLSFWATETFKTFYCIARNRGTRSLNIDNNSVFFFGILKN
jgi:DNA (cytosine-5)-methyltransferase 1